MPTAAEDLSLDRHSLPAVVLASMLALGPVMAPVGAQSGGLFDFGDAPDGTPTGYPTGFAQTGRFPTLLASQGARTEFTLVALGPTVDRESDANVVTSPMGPGDGDDGLTDMQLLLRGPGGTSTLTVEVDPRSGISQGATYHLNVLIDLDRDGAWGGTASGGEPEWAVKNHEIVLDDPTATRQVTTPPFQYSDGPRAPSPAWMRVALTSAPVVATDWDGTGSWRAGEVEDHLVVTEHKHGRTWCMQQVYFFLFDDEIPFWCTVLNDGMFDNTIYAGELERIDGGVAVSYNTDDYIPGGPAPNPGAAPPSQQPDPAMGQPRDCPRSTGVAAQPGGPATPNVGGDMAIHRQDQLYCWYDAIHGEPTPSNWEWRIAIADPPATIHPWGVNPGHGGDVTIPLEFRGIPQECTIGTVIQAPCEDELVDFFEDFAELGEDQDVVREGDVVGLLLDLPPFDDGGATDSFFDVFVDVELPPEDRVLLWETGSDEVDLVTDPSSLPEPPDIALGGSRDTLLNLMNAREPANLALIYLQQDLLGVNFLATDRQVAWNALVRNLIQEVQTTPFAGAGTAMTINGENCTAQPYEDYPDTYMCDRFLLDVYGIVFGVLSEGRDTFKDPPAALGITFDQPPGVINQDLDTLLEPLPENNPDYVRPHILSPPDTESTISVSPPPSPDPEVRGSWTTGMDYLQDSGGGSFAVGMGANQQTVTDTWSSPSTSGWSAAGDAGGGGYWVYATSDAVIAP